jgi:hypothetical protein
MVKERGGTGQYVETTTLDAVLGVFEDVRGPVVTSADVADALDCSRDTARRKLAELHREGEVDRRETAGRVVWWLPDGETAVDPEAQLKRLSTDLDAPITVGETVYEDGDSHSLDANDAAAVGTSSTVESEDGPTASESSGERNLSGPERVVDPGDTGETPAHVERDVSAESAPESVEGVDVGALDLPGRGDDLRRRQAAVRAVLAHLREHGTAQAGDLRALAWDTDGGTYADAQSLWKNCVLKRALTPLDAAESAGPSGKWRWVGDS